MLYLELQGPSAALFLVRIVYFPSLVVKLFHRPYFLVRYPKFRFDNFELKPILNIGFDEPAEG